MKSALVASESIASRPPLPRPRGPLSEYIIGLITSSDPSDSQSPPEPAGSDPLGHDAQLALYIAYEGHYRGFDGVSDSWEWDSRLLEFRASLESQFDRALSDLVGAIPSPKESIPRTLEAIVASTSGPSLSRNVEREAGHEQLLEFVVHKSGYHLKEADPHTWAIPRLEGPAKAALVEVQADEYGGGRAERMHATLFANMMKSLGLNPRYGAYIDILPGSTLAVGNLISRFGLHRDRRGALAGHLAAFEMTSCEPNRRYARGLRRVFGEGAPAKFFDEHVEADAVHEQIAARDLAGGLAFQEPGLVQDILFGASACLALEGLFGARLMESWQAGRSSLLP